MDNIDDKSEENNSIKPIGKSIYKNVLAAAYDWSSSTLLRNMRTLKMNITRRKKLTPKEIEFICKEYGEPNWETVKRLAAFYERKK